MPGSFSIFSPALKNAQPLACQLLETAIERGCVANGYLLVGPAVEEKHELVKQVACFLNCAKPNRLATGSCLLGAYTADRPLCLNCQWLADGQHPQAWLQLKGEGRSGKIPAESARLLTAELAKTSAYARVVVVEDAAESTFHRPAANVLLKVIEEPPADVLFFFYADNAEDVLATITSRCQVVNMARPIAAGSAGAQTSNTATIPSLDRLPAVLAGKKTKSERYPLVIEDALSLSQHLQELLKGYQSEMDEHAAFAAVVDAVLLNEHRQIKEAACGRRQAVAYLTRVLSLGETSKRHNLHYIKPANALDTFCLSLIDLKLRYFADASHAKQ